MAYDMDLLRKILDAQDCIDHLSAKDVTIAQLESDQALLVEFAKAFRKRASSHSKNLGDGRWWHGHSWNEEQWARLDNAFAAITHLMPGEKGGEG